MKPPCLLFPFWLLSPLSAQTLPPPSPGTPLSSATQEKIARMTPLFDGHSLAGWIQTPAASWVVKDGAMASTGAGRGVIYTQADYSHYRLIFTLRHVGVQSGKNDHQPCILIFCTRPAPGEKGL